MKYITTLLITICVSVYGQDYSDLLKKIESSKPGDSQFLLRGYAHSGYEKRGEESSFVGGSFNPIFLWRQSDKLLFEAELELELEHGETALALEYANMAYELRDNLTVRVGMFLLPFGTFSERLHPRWINRLPSSPLGFGHDPIGPMRDMGIELRGNTKLGSRSLSYSLYSTNGPSLNDGEDHDLSEDEAGMLNYLNFEDNNSNKAIGGRLGIFPLASPALELGFSGQIAEVGNHETEYENTAANLYALDMSYVNNIIFLKGVVDLKGQLNQINVDDESYFSDEDSSSYSFLNQSQASYLQASFRPAYVRNSFVKNLEIVGRYSQIETPEGALWESNQSQYVVGLNYWLDWRTVLKIAYQVNESSAAGGHVEEDEHGDEGGDNAILIHWAFGF
ncbi:MAG: hypothetical protein HQ556_12315 [Candidatus Marinimicrobia bacterium]|nr:hypothetical protein [Candidatus Neomarinimicrobiota bacterium]